MSAFESGVGTAVGRVRGAEPAAVLATGAAALGGALVGAAYALSAYELGPQALPLAAVATVALALGTWRLEYGLALLLALTPFVEDAPITEPADAKLRVAIVAWAGALVAVQSLRVLHSGERLRAPALLAPAALFLLVALIGVPVAADATSAAAKFMLLAGSVLVYALIATFLTSWRRLLPVLAALTASAAAIGLHAAYQYAVGDTSAVGFLSDAGTVEYRVASFFPHPNQLAGFLVVLAPVPLALVALTRSPALRAACVATAVLALAVVVLTYSRGALVASLVLPLVLLRDRRVWPLAVGALAVAALLSPDVWRERVVEITETDQPEVVSRLDFWDAGWAMFEQRPLAGVGLNAFPDEYVAVERPARTFVGGGFLDPPDSAHNLYVNTLAEQGLLGFAALLALWIAYGALCLRLRGSPDPRVRALALALLASGLALTVHNAFDVTFLDPKTATAAWALIGVAGALARIDARARETAAEAAT